MASRLIIDGNSVYEIDEECEDRIRKEIGSQYGQRQKMMQELKQFQDKSSKDNQTNIETHE